MAYTHKIKRGKNRKALTKTRSVYGITPKGYKFHKVEGDKIIYTQK